MMRPCNAIDCMMVLSSLNSVIFVSPRHHFLAFLHEQVITVDAPANNRFMNVDVDVVLGCGRVHASVQGES